MHARPEFHCEADRGNFPGHSQQHQGYTYFVYDKGRYHIHVIKVAMRSTTVNSESAAGQQWEDDLYKFCTFEDFTVEGKPVSGDFIDCTFKRLDWYWGFFAGVTFLRCRFEHCVFSGCSFTEARFVECAFENCRFQKDNLDGDCDFAGAVAYECDLGSGCPGFEPTFYGSQG